jgi:glycosyltransferase involved in cell wall biosynthesis
LKISVVICTYNRADQLRETLEHWTKLSSTHAWEIVLVDNASTDSTREVVEDFLDCLPNLRAVYEQRRSLGAARQRGWREARGELIAFTDDDCYPDRDYIDQIARVFDEVPEIGYLSGQIQLWDKEDLPLTIDTRQCPVDIPSHSFVAAGTVQGANFAFRRTTLVLVGGFDPALGAGTRYPCEDIDAVARVSWAGVRGRYDPRPLVFHHHRRRKEHWNDIRRNYDYGRGAYFAKFILRRDTSMTYLKAWVRSAIQCARTRDGIRQTFREASSAIAYAVDRGR